MEFNFQYTKKEYVDSRRNYLFMSKAITKINIVLLFVLLGMDVFWLIREISAFGIVLGVLALFALLFISFLYFYLPPKRFEKNKMLQNMNYLKITEDGLLLKTECGEDFTDWNRYKELWESDKYFFLIKSLNDYLMIPKRIFSNDDEGERFKEMFLKSHKQRGFIRF